MAPEILRQETFHALLKAKRRFRWTAADLVETVARFRALPIQYASDPDWPNRAFELAQQLGTGLFDTIYLVAAIDLDAELWTRDQRFAAATSRRLGDRLHLA